jgi:hypothetical protein
MKPRETDYAPAGSRLRASVAAVRSQALDLLREASRQGLASHRVTHEAVARLQRVANDLGEAFKAIPHEAARPVRDPLADMKPAPSRDAAAVITLAAVCVPPSAHPVEQAERWLRILRLYGRVGDALQHVGVPESPVATVAEPVSAPQDPATEMDSPAMVAEWAATLAQASGARTVDTVHVLFAARKVFGTSLDRALYRRGTRWDQLVRGLVVPVRVAAAG